MVKVAVIFESSPFDRKGLFNAVHNRIRHLAAEGGCLVHAFCIHSWDTPFTAKVRRTPLLEERVSSCVVDDVTYKMLWYDFSITDHILVEKLHKRPFFFEKFAETVLPELAGYDFISAHSFTGGLLAAKASHKYGIPYCVTWHGSDVHTHPWRNDLILKETARAMEGASCNFFVSDALMETSDRITLKASKKVLYNGVSDDFVKYDSHSRAELRKRYGVADGVKVVAFVGSLAAVKNVRVLQPLFHEIRRCYDGPLEFWVVGDGKLRHVVEPALKSDDSIDVRLWGNVPSVEMPSVMNCVDVMVLPSLNEGLPLVCAEAIRCGANVVGSDVGGIPEVIGKDHVVPLGDGFLESMAGKVVGFLRAASVQSVPEKMDWKAASAIESEAIMSAVSKGRVSESE